MSRPKVDRNNEIVRLRDEEGRVFRWIAEYVSKKYKSPISEKNVLTIYYREKTKQAIAKRRQSL